MNIHSTGEALIVTMPDTGFMHFWHKSTHRAHVYNRRGQAVDTYSFAFEKNKPSMLDFTESLQAYIEDGVVI